MGKPWGVTRPLGYFSTIGAQYTAGVLERNKAVERKCTSPSYVGSISEKGQSLPTIPLQAVRCRKCKGCLKAREAQWSYRAGVEYLISERTWWLTLTYAGSKEPTYDDVKLFFKKLRKKHEFRYVISEERGTEKERLHWHILVHCSNSLTRREIERCWNNGFVNARLARHAGLGRYLAKYLAKQSRIRASKHYGSEEQIRQHLSEEINSNVEHFIRTGSKVGYCLGSEVTLSKYGLHIPGETLERWLALSSIPF